MENMVFDNIYTHSSYLDGLDSENHSLEVPPYQNQFAFSRLPGPVEYDGIFDPSSASDYGLPSTYAAHIGGNAGPLQLSPGPLGPPNLFEPSQGDDYLGSFPTESVQTAKEKSPPGSRSPMLAAKRGPRKLRRQNRSCDPCRAAKRACDLPSNATFSNDLASPPCSMCEIRGTDCKATWRASKESFRGAKKLVPCHDHDAGIEHSKITASRSTHGLASPECNLARHVMAGETRSQRLGVYIDIFDIPMSKLLSERCMPPCYSFGISALTPLSQNAQLAALFSQAQSSIDNCWEMPSSSRHLGTAAPRLFLAASILDALFECADSQSKRPRSTLRDIALNDTYKWVAIAIGSQFSVYPNAAEDIGRSHQQARDMACAAWCTAKHMVFTNIAASKSFRLGLSLLFFGTILPPTETDESHEFEEDSSYALNEGIRRIQMLCAEARSYLRNCNIRPSIITPLVGLCRHVRRQHMLHSLSIEAHENVLELIAAFEWLVVMSLSVGIALFPCRSFPVAPSINNPKVGNTHSIEEISQRVDAKGWDNEGNLKSMDDAIIARVNSETKPVMMLWNQGAADHLVNSTLLESGSLVVLMWKALARLTLAMQDLEADEVNYAEIRQHFQTMIMLICLWRTSFGTTDHKTAMNLQLATSDLRRGVVFCATDGDLAVLIFYELACQLQRHLADQPQSQRNSLLHEALNLTSNYRNSQRLTSAMQISYLASTNLGVSSLGFQGKAGLKADIEDVRAHPVSIV